MGNRYYLVLRHAPMGPRKPQANSAAFRVEFRIILVLPFDTDTTRYVSQDTEAHLSYLCCFNFQISCAHMCRDALR